MPKWSEFVDRLNSGRSAATAGGQTAHATRGRVTGVPPSANGASSFHLDWGMPGRYAAVEVTFEVLAPPTVPRLYFWALQAGFSSGGGRQGAGHLGLQWHPDYPGSTAINWGGYDARGTILGGTESSLRGSIGNLNTRDYPWRPQTPYRLRIDRDGTPASTGLTRWRGSVTDLSTETTTLVRSLDGGGTHLVNLCMWSEVFAQCEDPSVWVRWSDPVAYDDQGRSQRPRAARVNYQSHGDGGCANTNSFPDDEGIVQATATRRTTPQGTKLSFG